ncbi:MAG: DUF899 family protein [Chitinophagales bacterium]|nr:DUF899 family protein [Chitinophagales bacterium]
MNEATYEKITALQKEINEKHKQITALRKELTDEQINDYVLKNGDGKPVLLSSLFNEKNELLVIHNMGKKCVYCTLWADGFNGVLPHLTNRLPVVLVSPDEPQVQKEFAQSRGWGFNMLSAHGSTFIADLGFEPKPGMHWPGVSALVRRGDKIFRVSKDNFGPGDNYCSVWPLLDLLPNGANGWQPKYEY